MKGDRLLIELSEVKPFAKGIIITGTIKSGRLSLKQNVYLHETSSGIIIQCSIIDIRNQNGFLSQAKSGDKITSYLIGTNAGNIVIGKTYISGTMKSIRHSREKADKTESKRVITDKSSFSKQKEGTIDTDFSSHSSFQISNQKVKGHPESVSTKEKELVGCIQACIKSGSNLSATERYIISKIANSFNITAERCDELIKRCLKRSQDNKNIEIFRDAILTCLLDSNYISKTEHMLLERLRLSLNIPEDVAHNMIYQCNWSYSEILKEK